MHHRFKKNIPVFLALSFLFFFSFAFPHEVFAADTTPCQTLCTGTLIRGNFDYNMGYKFTPNTDGTITTLWSKEYDGGAQSTIRLYKASDGTLLASATVTNVTGTWVSASITPVSVSSGTAYVVAVRDAWYYYVAQTFPVTTGDLTINTALVSVATDNMPATSEGSDWFGLADVTFTPGGGGGGGGGGGAPARIIRLTGHLRLRGGVRFR